MMLLDETVIAGGAIIRIVNYVRIEAPICGIILEFSHFLIKFKSLFLLMAILVLVMFLLIEFML